MQSLELLENRELRNKNLNRIEILEKIGNLLLLPNKDFATTKQVAEFFEVNLETIQKLIQRNKEELVSSGLTSLKGQQLKQLKETVENVDVGAIDNKSIPKKVTILTIIPKRAILNIGMLLRDSEVAKRLRQALLDVIEESPKASIKVTKNLLAERDIYIFLEQYLIDELTFKKTKNGIFDTLSKIPFQKRVPIVDSLKDRITESLDGLEKKEFAKAYDLLTLTNELSEHLVSRIDHSKFLMVTKRNKTILQLEHKLQKATWKPEFSIQTNYSCFSKNAMYAVVTGKLVTSKAYAIWKKNFPYELIKSGLKKEFYTQPFEWCVSGTFFSEMDLTNVINPVQDQIAKALNRDDKEIYFRGFIHEEVDYADDWKKTKMKLYFRLLPQGEKDGSI